MRKKIFWVGLILFVLAATGGLLSGQPKPVDPVNWRELVPFLIDISGYEADKPEGTTTSMGQFKLSQASRNYAKGEQSIEIEIIDGSYIPMAYASFKVMEGFEVDSSEELIKRITVAGFPGIEHIQFEEEEASLMILVAERFLVNIKGEKFTETAELKDIANKMDLNKLASLAK